MTDTRDLCTQQLPGDLRSENEPVFNEPWQAQAFAMAVSLIEAGVIGWQQWSNALGEEITRASELGIADDGTGYYELWLRTLERLVSDAELVSEDELGQLKQAWTEAYAHTPHGQPVTLD